MVGESPPPSPHTHTLCSTAATSHRPSLTSLHFTMVSLKQLLCSSALWEGETWESCLAIGQKEVPSSSEYRGGGKQGRN